MRSTRLAILFVAGLGLSGCAGLNETQQRTGTGALGGAALGGIVGSFTGNAGLGALLGAGAGGLGGYVYDQSQPRRRYSDDQYQPRRRNSRF